MHPPQLRVFAKVISALLIVLLNGSVRPTASADAQLGREDRATQRSVSRSWAVIATANSQGVVLPVSIAPTALDQCSRPTPGAPDGYWEPEKQDILSLERLLPTYMETRTESAAALVRNRLSHYRRQYAGFLRADHKTIYANLFLPEYGVEWRHQVVMVCDGGAGFWGVEFDVTSQTFVHIAYNGSG